MLVALLVSAAAFIATAFITLITDYGCHGSDVSEPPPEGSFGDLICPGPALASNLALGSLAVVAPLLALSPWPRWFDLRIGFAISAGSILVMGVLVEAIESSGGLFVVPALLVFAAAVALAVRSR